MKRKDAINALRFAGYHGDNAAFTRIWIMERISRVAAAQAYREGAAAKARGITCTCRDCRPTK